LNKKQRFIKNLNHNDFTLFPYNFYVNEYEPEVIDQKQQFPRVHVITNKHVFIKKNNLNRTTQKNNLFLVCFYPNKNNDSICYDNNIIEWSIFICGYNSAIW